MPLDRYLALLALALAPSVVLVWSHAAPVAACRRGLGRIAQWCARLDEPPCWTCGVCAAPWCALPAACFTFIADAAPLHAASLPALAMLCWWFALPPHARATPAERGKCKRCRGAKPSTPA